MNLFRKYIKFSNHSSILSYIIENMKTITQTHYINAPIGAVWTAFTDPILINKWGGGPAVMDGKVGTEFSLWGGDIHGKNIEIETEKKLVQEWYAGEWSAPSTVTFTFSTEGSKTKVDIVHENVLDSEVDEIDNGWKVYFIVPIQELLEE